MFKNKPFFQFASLYVCVFGTFAFIPFLPLFFREKGFSDEQIGLLMALVTMSKVLFGPFAGALVDQGFSSKKMMLFLCTFAFGASMLFLAEASFPVFILLTLLLGGAFYAQAPLSDHATSRAILRRDLKEYGPIRSFGTASYLGFTLLAGWVFDIFSPAVIVFMMMGACVLNFGAICNLSEKYLSDNQWLQKIPFKRLYKNKSFMAIIIMSSLLHSAHALLSSFGYLHWSNLGMSTEVISYMVIPAIASEVAVFILAQKFFARHRVGSALAISALAGAFRFYVYAETSSPYVIFACQTLHGFSFGMNHSAVLHYIRNEIPKASAARAQALYDAFATGIVSGSATLGAGVLYSHMRGEAYFVSSAICVAVLVSALVARGRLVERAKLRALETAGRLVI